MSTHKKRTREETAGQPQVQTQVRKLKRQRTARAEETDTSSDARESEATDGMEPSAPSVSWVGLPSKSFEIPSQRKNSRYEVVPGAIHKS